MKNINKIITISLISSISLFGSSPKLPNSSTIDRQIKAPKDIPLHEKESVKIEEVESNSLKVDDSLETIFIKSFKIEGNSKISSEEILKSLKTFENKDLTFNQIQEVIEIVSKVYRDKGYFVARAYIGNQDILKNDNTLIITVLEGIYGEFNIENKSYVKDSIVQQIFDNAKKREVINSQDIERAMLLLNDRAGAKVTKSQIKAGQKIGSSNFIFEADIDQRVDGYIVADNYGSRYTGYNRLQALMDINSPFYIGDKILISGLISNGEDLKNGKIAYELPLNSYGLKGDIAYSRTNYNLVEEYKDLDAKGNSNIYEAGLSYPLIRTIDNNLYIKIKYYHKDLNDYIFNEKYEHKNINSFVARLDYEKNYYLGNFPSRFYSNLNLTTGHLKSTYNKDNDGRYNKIDTYLSNEIAFSDIFSLNTTLEAQKVLGHKNLDGSEDISLGGEYDVKVYPDSEKSAENGYIVSLEFFTQLPNISEYRHKVGVFYDIGDVYQEINKDSTFKRGTLQDIGLGYYVNYKDFFAKVQMAWVANSQPITSEFTNHKNSKLLLQGGWVF